MQKIDIETNEGTFSASYSDKGLARLEFPQTKRNGTNAKTATLILRSAAVCEASAAARGYAEPLGVCGRAAAGRDDTAALRVKMRIADAKIAAKAHPWHKLTTAAVTRALRGQACQELPPLDISDATEFQHSVWAVLRKIPKGTALTYSQVARAIGKPKAVRAVGGACGANPIPLLIPCHRVVASNAGLGGFSGGLQWKRALLEREGVR